MELSRRVLAKGLLADPSLAALMAGQSAAQTTAALILVKIRPNTVCGSLYDSVDPSSKGERLPRIFQSAAIPFRYLPDLESALCYADKLKKPASGAAESTNPSCIHDLVCAKSYVSFRHSRTSICNRVVEDANTRSQQSTTCGHWRCFREGHCDGDLDNLRAAVWPGNR